MKQNVALCANASFQQSALTNDQWTMCRLLQGMPIGVFTQSLRERPGAVQEAALRIKSSLRDPQPFLRDRILASASMRRLRRIRSVSSRIRPCLTRAKGAECLGYHPLRL
jgi:hypothetical protein